MKTEDSYSKPLNLLGTLANSAKSLVMYRMAHGGRRTAAITGDEPMIQKGLIGTLEVFVRKPARDPSFIQSG